MTVRLMETDMSSRTYHLHSLQDLTFCYLHMTRHDLQVLDTFETPEYIKGELSDDGWCLDMHLGDVYTMLKRANDRT